MTINHSILFLSLDLFIFVGITMVRSLAPSYFNNVLRVHRHPRLELPLTYSNDTKSR